LLAEQNRQAFFNAADPSRRLPLSVLDEGFRRNAQPLVQPPDHFQRQRALAREHLMIGLISTALPFRWRASTRSY
jgi:hypothetical protein